MYKGSQELSKGGYDYIVVFKGKFGPFFKFWDQLTTLMDWNHDDKKVGKTAKGDALFIYICDEERTKNLL